MKLPSNEIGISDLIQYRDCPQLMAFGMRRHVELPERLRVFEGEKDDPPESESVASAYGSCIHDMIALVEKTACSDQDALDACWPRYQHWLEPQDIPRLLTDMETYHTRSLLGYRLIAAETDMQVPLFVHNGEWVYFRFKIDALYQHIQNPSVFLMRDYKSSRWPKSEEEVHKDLQQWSYNFGVHEMFPECRTLVQMYDQLRYGAIPTRKNDAQRAQIKVWLIQQIKAVLADEVMAPTQNEWCPYCPLVVECRETLRASEHWKSYLAAVAPRTKVGRKLVMELSAQPFTYYVELLPKLAEARKHIEAAEKQITAMLLDMPTGERESYGVKTQPGKKMPRFSAEALRTIYAETGEEFWHLASITKAAAERFYGKDTDEVEGIMARAHYVESAPSIKAPSS